MLKTVGHVVMLKTSNRYVSDATKLVDCMGGVSTARTLQRNEVAYGVIQVFSADGGA
jgi:hypothetical protein